jgi:hypothetical protein
MSARFIARCTARLTAHLSARFVARGAMALTIAACLGACANPWQRFQAGDDVTRVTASLGKPHEVYPLPGGGQRLMWPTQPMGETTTAADVDAGGKLLSIRQVLTNNEFAQADIGKWTKNDVLVHFGKPEETAYFPLMKREVWSYRYMDSDVWYMLYHFYFDDTGVLRQTQKSPDPLHDPDNRFGSF